MHLLCNADAYHGDSHSRKIFPNTNSPSCVTQAGFSSLMVSWYVASTTNTDIHVSDQLFTSHFTFYFFFEPPPYLLVKFIEHRTRFLTLPKLTEFLWYYTKKKTRRKTTFNLIFNPTLDRFSPIIRSQSKNVTLSYLNKFPNVRKMNRATQKIIFIS